jgi:hypothetical protein
MNGTHIGFVSVIMFVTCSCIYLGLMRKTAKYCKRTVEIRFSIQALLEKAIQMFKNNGEKTAYGHNLKAV